MENLDSLNTFPLIDNIKIHIQVQKRNARKNITTVVGLDLLNLDLKKLLKTFKKTFQCNGTVDEGKKSASSGNQQKNQSQGAIIMSGDQRENVKKFLIDNKIVEEEFIVVHGY